MSQGNKSWVLAAILSLNFLVIGFLVGKELERKSVSEEIEVLRKEIESMTPTKDQLSENFWEDLPEFRPRARILKDSILEGIVLRQGKRGFILKTKEGLVSVRVDESVLKEKNISDGDRVIVRGKFSKVGRFNVFDLDEIKKE